MSHLLDEMSLRNTSDRIGKIRYVVSEKTESFKDVCEFFLGKTIKETIEIVNLE